MNARSFHTLRQAGILRRQAGGQPCRPRANLLADPMEQDNAYNQTSADHMAHQPEWLPPQRFDIGVVNPATVWVYLRASAVKQ